MSDERDDADARPFSEASGSGTADPRGSRTAVVTRPQRPTGKRSRRRSDTDDSTDDESSSHAVELTESSAEVKKGKKAKTARKSRGPSVNPIAYVYNYLKQVVAELRKVIWPNRKQMMTYTSVVLTFLVFMVTLIGLVDLGLAKLVLQVFG